MLDIRMFFSYVYNNYLTNSQYYVQNFPPTFP